MIEGSVVCLELCLIALLLGIRDELGEVIAHGVDSCTARLAMFWSRHGLIRSVSAFYCQACLQLCQPVLFLGMRDQVGDVVADGVGS